MISPISNDRKEKKAASPHNGEGDVNSAKARPHAKLKRQVFAILHQDIEIILAYGTHYLAARTDAVKAKIRRTILWMMAAILVLVAAAAAVLTGVILIVTGFAEVMTVVFGDRAWAGNLTTGILMIVLMALTIYGGMNSLLKYSYRQLRYNYDRRRKAEQGLHQRAETETSQPEC